MPPPPLTRLPFLLARNASANALVRLRLSRGTTTTAAPVVAFSTSPSALVKKHQMPPRPKPPPDSEIEESYLKGSGPGGQKINKTSSAVQLKHIPTGIVVKSQATRSRSQNRKIARELLAQKIDDLQNGDQSRSAIVGEVKRKKAASAAKKSKRKYRKLEEEKAEEMQEDADADADAEADDTVAPAATPTEQAEQQTNHAPSAEIKPRQE
ncbi:peptidyl-trna hydrolase domain protein [Colletotrichum plurivorum]|uniref:Peptidyl-trna hydrolase domain protein n=1 Tax=Colletotrichum plurivorum TaxID=2175906 RepID=A0A8H6U656_9PEZI|nr:peptidyl-trna hydrolase domain protein [Colletotrichum plurivorum]